MFNNLEFLILRLFNFEKLDIKQVKIKLPETMGSFHFISELSPDKPVNMYKLGVYKNNSGHRILAKFWYGSKNSVAYHWLKNEAEVYKMFSKTLQTSKPNSKLRISRLISFKDEDTYSVLVMEYIDGTLISDLDIIRQKEIYLDVIHELEIMDKKINKSRSQIAPLSLVSMTAAFPFLAVKSVISCPDQILKIVTGVVKFIANYPMLLMIKSDCFVHRDLKDNIIVSNNQYYLFDFQTSALTFSLFEVTNLILSIWTTKDLLKEINNTDLVRKILGSVSSRKAYASLSIYTALIDMGLVHSNTKEDISDYLNYSLSL